MNYVFSKIGGGVVRQIPADDYCDIIDWLVAKTSAGQEWRYMGCIHPGLGEFPIILEDDPIDIFLNLWLDGQVDYHIGEPYPFGVGLRNFADLKDVLDALESE